MTARMPASAGQTITISHQSCLSIITQNFIALNTNACAGAFLSDQQEIAETFLHLIVPKAQKLTRCSDVVWLFQHLFQHLLELSVL